MIYFECDLSKCHSACCRNGYKVPLIKGEREKIESMLPRLKGILSDDVISHLQKGGITDSFIYALDGKGCPFLYEGGCSIQTLEDADFPKPLGCHLFPLVVNGKQLKYRPRSCCQFAMLQGFARKIRLQDFLKDALLRAEKFNYTLD